MRDLTIYNIDMAIAEAYAANLEKHIECVIQAGEKLGVPLEQLKQHDASKWSVEQFPHYATWFYGKKDNPVAFEYALQDHVCTEKHHWERWIYNGNFVVLGGANYSGCLEMPEHYLLEMIADWQGASIAYSGTDDMTNWLSNNLHKVRLHHKSRYKLSEHLNKLGYDGIVMGMAMAAYYNVSWECYQLPEKHESCSEPKYCICQCHDKRKD